jgi:hypothetical protein
LVSMRRSVACRAPLAPPAVPRLIASSLFWLGRLGKDSRPELHCCHRSAPRASGAGSFAVPIHPGGGEFNLSAASTQGCSRGGQCCPAHPADVAERPAIGSPPERESSTFLRSCVQARFTAEPAAVALKSTIPTGNGGSRSRVVDFIAEASAKNELLSITVAEIRIQAP